MIEVINQSTDPYFNLALEEYMVKDFSGSENYFMLWKNRPAVIIGRNQNTLDEINQEYIKERGIQVVRRTSGGGAVYHDYGNLNFTFVVNAGQDFANFEKFTYPVIKTLKRLGISAENTGRNDITIEGKKFSGNAQFRYKDRLLHHGTILFDSNIGDMTKALNPGLGKTSPRGIKSVRSRVANVSEYLTAEVSIDKFRQMLVEEVLQKEKNNSVYELTGEELQAVRDLRNNKYTSWEWVYGASPAYNIRKTHKFIWGNIDIRLEVKQDLINGCKIYGDYFAMSDIDEMERAFTGQVYRKEKIRDCLQRLEIKRFLPHADEDEIIKMLFN